MYIPDMHVCFDIINELENTINQIAKASNIVTDAFSANVRISDPRFGDFQADGILPYAKANKKNPRELGEQLLQVISNDERFKELQLSFELSGPGFINIKLSKEFLINWVTQFNPSDFYKFTNQSVYKNKSIVVDYSSPNTAKQMHVGHLRSMIIGEAIVRILRLHGANIIRDNHIGDWGTQFGILIMAIKRSGYDLEAQHTDAIEDLEKLYKEGSALFKTDETAKKEAYKELLDLQNGVPASIALWEKIKDVSWDAFEYIYKIMGIEFDLIRGESYYRDKVERVYKELSETKIAQESDGALVVFHPEHPRFKDFPFIIRKKDGTSNYASTDLATILENVETLKADELIYVTDGRQQDHFEQLFLTAKKWFEALKYKLPICKHIWFGTILGEDGKAIKTRSGDPIKLKDLLNEAIERAYAIVNEKNPSLSEDEKQNIARVVGLGAVKYADLSQNRTSDYIFSWDKLLSFDGNTAPYLLYAVARICSIFRKAEIQPSGVDLAHTKELTTPTELTLAKKLILFPQTLEQVSKELKPHILCTYLYELAVEFSSFYNANKVITEDKAEMNTRLLLCLRTLETLRSGLDLLGIETVDKM